MRNLEPYEVDIVTRNRDKMNLKFIDEFEYEPEEWELDTYIEECNHKFWQDFFDYSSSG